MSKKINKFIIIPCISEFFIILNIYNGDIIGISENIEYSLWHTFSLIISSLFNDTFSKEHFVLLLAIITNYYWFFFYPWNIDSNRFLVSMPSQSTLNNITFFEKAIVISRPRHRTEFYVSHGVLTSYLFSLIACAEF